MPRYDVIGVGAASIDFVYLLPATPQPDTATAKLRISRQLVSPGGQTATVLCTCTSFGLTTKFVGTVGSDQHGHALIDSLRDHSVDATGVIIKPGPTPYAVILIDERHGERIVLWDRQPSAVLCLEDVKGTDLSDARVVHVDDVDVDMAIHTASLARSAGARVTSDIERTDDAARALAAAVDVALFAEHVLPALEPGKSIEAALRALRRSRDQMVGVTLGARGAMLLAGDEVFRVDGHVVDAVDTTGAGDVFRGAFIAAWLRGDSPGDVLAFANAAAAASCLKLGAISGVPSPEETAALLRGRA